MKFKTNAKCGGCSATILKGMREHFPNQEWTLDLDSADKVLEMHGIPDDPEKAAEVEKAIAATGFKGSWIPAPSDY
ncbi:MAG: heavy metal transport/detoxification protein [Muribaculaceae bacterium]|nr:heavy metal transport/detoxification protein [Muribaculaceae bacterium]